MYKILISRFLLLSVHHLLVIRVLDPGPPLGIISYQDARPGAALRRLAVSMGEDDEVAREVRAGYGFAPLQPVEWWRLAWQLPI